MIAEMLSEFAVLHDSVQACEWRCTTSSLPRKPAGELRWNLDKMRSGSGEGRRKRGL